MQTLKMITFPALIILLLGLTGCGSAAPAADSSDVKSLVIKICRRRGVICDFGINQSCYLKLRAIRTTDVNEKLKRTVAQAELLVYIPLRHNPVIYDIAYTAQYTTDGELYVTILEAR